MLQRRSPVVLPDTPALGGRGLPPVPVPSAPADRRVFVRLRPAGDVLTGVAVAVCLIVGTLGAARGQAPPDRAPLGAFAYVLMFAIVPPLAGWRRWPAATYLVCSVLSVVYVGLDHPYGPMHAAPFLPLFALARDRSPRVSLAACLAVMAASLLVQVLPPTAHMPVEWLPGVAGSTVLLLLPWAFGLVVRARDDQRRAARDEEVRAAAFEERLRVAREVHDVVGHGLSVIHMQASVAIHVLGRRPEQARPALEAIKRASKESLDELRATLEVFREPGDDSPAGRGVSGLAGLVERCGGGPLTVGLTIEGDSEAVPAAVSRAVYRIAQEALTNVVRHSGAAHARVSVRVDGRAVVLEVTDDGRAAVVAVPGGGLTGMRHRAVALGGTLEATALPEGGFRVRAVLPLPSTD